MFHPATLDELDDPARIQIDAEADAATKLRQVLHGQPQPPRTRRAQHQPVRPGWKILIRQRAAEQLVVGAKVVDGDAALGHARGAAGLEHVNRLVGAGLGHPAADRPATQPLVLERLELAKVVKRADILERVEFQPRGVIEPERAARRGMEVPLHDLVRMRVQLLAGGFRAGRDVAADRRADTHGRSLGGVIRRGLRRRASAVSTARGRRLVATLVRHGTESARPAPLFVLASRGDG